MELRWITPGDTAAVMAASDLFDYGARQHWARGFLQTPNHHLCIAYEDDQPAGFVSAIEMTHPDKGTEMFLYELGVGEEFRGRGIGRALVTALADFAQERGCYGMWVLTDAANEPAMRTYTTAGATDRDDQTMLTWRFDPTHQTFVNPPPPS